MCASVDQDVLGVHWLSFGHSVSIDAGISFELGSEARGAVRRMGLELERPGTSPLMLFASASMLAAFISRTYRARRGETAPTSGLIRRGASATSSANLTRASNV